MAEPREPRQLAPLATPMPEAVITLSGDTNRFSIDLNEAPPVQPTDIERYVMPLQITRLSRLQCLYTKLTQRWLLCRADSGPADLLLPGGDNREGSEDFEDRPAAPVTYKDILLRFLWLG